MYHIYIWLFLHPMLTILILTLSLVAFALIAYKCLHSVEIIPCVLLIGLVYILVS